MALRRTSASGVPVKKAHRYTLDYVKRREEAAAAKARQEGFNRGVEWGRDKLRNDLRRLLGVETDPDTEWTL